MNCFYLIDKPPGITSFDVIRKLRKILNVKKIGHTGTLDPLATGLLLVATGNYTKLIPYLKDHTKEYEFKVSLDGKSPSFDKETEVTYLSNEKQEYYRKTLTKELIEDILKNRFIGKINQIPPKYSALKIGGKKALDMVRAGRDFELKPKEVTIFSMEVLDFNYPEVFIRAKVSAGTYIRSIARDLGDILGTGGYVTFLKRVAIGDLDLSLAQTLDNFDVSKKIKEEKLFPNHLFISLSEDELNDINNGKSIKNAFSFLKNFEEYFVKNDDYITNVVKVINSNIKPIRKI